MSFNYSSSIVELCPSSPERVARYFKEIFATEVFKIPDQKPPKEQIVNVSRTITIEDVETIFVDLPDPGVDGYKVFVAGNIYLGVQYAAKRPAQDVHFVRFQLPFQAVILNDCGGLIVGDDVITNDNYVVHVCVEKMIETQLDDRTILFELLLLVWVEAITP